TPNGATTNNCSTNDSVSFASLPTVSAVAVSGDAAADTPPTITVHAGQITGDTGCAASFDDQVSLIFPTPSDAGATTDTFTVTISGISYNVGSAAAIGSVALATATNIGATAAPVTPSNAIVQNKGNASVTANSPTVYVTDTASGTISNIVVTESAAGALKGDICVSANGFTFTGPGTATASSGSGAVLGTPTLVSTSELSVPISTPSTAAATYTLAGIGVTAPPASGPATAAISAGGTACTGETTSVTTGLVLFNAAPTVATAISGPDADATAIAELETAYPAPSSCPVNHSVILATDQNFPDALAASYLAGYLKTGILLTPTAQLSSETQSALKTEGITNVYVVGGPLAVSQNTISQVEATPAYNCGGTTATGSDITVTGPIFGQTQYDTAEQIAVTPGTANVKAVNLSGAYNNAYDDTTGAESATPSATGALRTAIVATGTNFQDATAGSVMAYNNQFPLLLTDPSSLSSQAQTGLSALGIQQVIVLGGPLAVSDADVASIQGMGISVIRIAGQDYTDTAQKLADFELNQSANFSGLGWGATTGTTSWKGQILVARGDFYSDALAGCVLASQSQSPILTTENPSTVGSYLAGFLNSGGSAAGIDGLNSVPGYSGNIVKVQPLGGPLALNFSTLTAISQAVAAG
ncbi:MAG: cell wall-binding repeat-containing protein, partial [Acidimicrobiales bacterium]